MSGKKAKIRSEAHSKIIFTGEHSVVYGYPAVAVPFPLKVSIDIWEEEGEVKVISPAYIGKLLNIPTEWRGMAVVIEEIHKYLNQPLQDITIEVQSEIPQGRGLGSSAAIAMALVKGLFQFYEKDLSDETLFHFVGLAETFAHGKPSGIDMMAVSYDTPIYFTKEDGANPFSCHFPLYIVVADSGIEGDTKNAVKQVRSRYEKDKSRIEMVLNRMGNIALEIKKAMEQSDSRAIGKRMTENHDCLKELGVSNKTLDKLVETALKAGALGAKLTGGGLGGCIVALADSEQNAEKIRNELIQKHAKASWFFCLSN